MRRYPFSRACPTWMLCLSLFLPTVSWGADDHSVVYEGKSGPGIGKHVVLVSGDEEYRSEEALPQLGKILAVRYGFKCTVLFAIDKDGTINPNVVDNIPGLETLDTADLMVIFTRFRDLPDDQLAHIVKYLQSGKPIVGLRTATHAFNLKSSKKFPEYTWTSKEWEGGFGRQVLGETWINHHGHHGVQSTRGILVADQKDHPILRGLKDGDIWGPTDVYTVRLPQPEGCQPLVMGQVLTGMKPDDAPLKGEKNDPMMPVAWVKPWLTESGKVARVFTTTMGASQDLESAGTRKMIVQACLWAVGLEDAISADDKVDLVGEFKPTAFKFGGHTAGVKPADLQLKD